MRLKVALTILAALVFAGTASATTIQTSDASYPWPAHVTTVSLVAAHTGIKRPELRRVAHALTDQVNGDLRRYWRVPEIRVVVGASAKTRIVVEPPTHEPWMAPGYLCGGAGSHEGADALVCRIPGMSWTVTASHELIEMLTDPSGNGREICDPVSLRSYVVDGVRLSDFVTPAWFRHRPHSDFLR